jgi:hypothetical protein
VSCGPVLGVPEVVRGVHTQQQRSLQIDGLSASRSASQWLATVSGPLSNICKVARGHRPPPGSQLELRIVGT